MAVDTKKVIDARREFVAKASLCEYNRLWRCMHPDNVRQPCTKICKNYNTFKDL